MVPDRAWGRFGNDKLRKVIHVISIVYDQESACALSLPSSVFELDQGPVATSNGN